MAKVEDYHPNWFRDHLSYDPETGQFKRLKSRQARHLGQDPCVIRADGYAVLSVEGMTFSAHRVAFAMMGKPVPKLVDHRNEVKSDNRWKNLRPSTPTQNLLNSKKRKGRTLPYNIYDRGNGRLRVMIVIRPDRYDLGSFDTLDAAIAARNAARLKLGLDNGEQT